jgi:patatin-like phospholipase/acyl hydrolase
VWYNKSYQTVFNSIPLIKFIYKVCKNFTLKEIDKQKVIIADNTQEEKGSHFAIGVEYVDYSSPENGETITNITKDLVAQKFLKLDREVNMR